MNIGSKRRTKSFQNKSVSKNADDNIKRSSSLGNNTNTRKKPAKKRNVTHRISSRAKTAINKTIQKKYQDVVIIMCPETHVCLAFGKTDGINNIFHQYQDFSMLSKTKNIFKRLSQGANGFVNEIVYELPYHRIIPKHNNKNDKYYVYTILKSSIDRTNQMADNLFYEAYIGKKYINQLSKRFPCFLETYNIFRHNNADMNVEVKNIIDGSIINEIHNTKSILENDFVKLIHDQSKKNKGFADFLNQSSQNNSGDIYLSDIFSKYPPIKIDVDNIEESVKNPNDICIQIQHVNDAMSLHSYIEKLYNAGKNIDQTKIPGYQKLVKFELNVVLPSILFQFVSALYALRDEYSHNDLHMGNILLYRIPSVNNRKQLVKIDYKDTSKGCTIYSPFMVKIIDYGRNHVAKDNLSSDYYTELCKHTNPPEPINHTPSLLNMPPPNNIAGIPAGINENDANDSISKYLGGNNQKTCGRELGYNFWDKFDNESDPKKHYVSCRMLNKSIDLLAIFRLGHLLYVTGLIDFVYEDLRDIIDKTLFFYIDAYATQMFAVKQKSGKINDNEYIVIEGFVFGISAIKNKNIAWHIDQKNPNSSLQEIQLNKFRNDIKIIIDRAFKYSYFSKPYGIYSAATQKNMISNIEDLYHELKKYCIMIEEPAFNELSKVKYDIYSNMEIDLYSGKNMKQVSKNKGSIVAETETSMPPPIPTNKEKSQQNMKSNHPMNSYV